MTILSVSTDPPLPRLSTCVEQLSSRGADEALILEKAALASARGVKSREATVQRRTDKALLVDSSFHHQTEPPRLLTRCVICDGAVCAIMWLLW